MAESERIIEAIFDFAERDEDARLVAATLRASRESDRWNADELTKLLVSHREEPK